MCIGISVMHSRLFALFLLFYGKVSEGRLNHFLLDDGETAEIERVYDFSFSTNLMVCPLAHFSIRSFSSLTMRSFHTLSKYAKYRNSV